MKSIQLSRLRTFLFHKLQEGKRHENNTQVTTGAGQQVQHIEWDSVNTAYDIIIKF